MVDSMDLHRTASLSAWPTIVQERNKRFRTSQKFPGVQEEFVCFCKRAAVVDSMDLYENNNRRFARWMYIYVISSPTQIQGPEVEFHVKENFEKNHDFQF